MDWSIADSLYARLQIWKNIRVRMLSPSRVKKVQEPFLMVWKHISGQQAKGYVPRTVCTHNKLEILAKKPKCVTD